MPGSYFLSVDYQYDFAGEGGKEKVIGNSPEFIKNRLLPFLIKHNIKVSEIISDYRLPRGKSHNESCVPGTLGFLSLLPDKVRIGQPHIKCMHNPIWTRKNIGNPELSPGKEFQNPELFNNWVAANFPDKRVPIIVFGETMECCVLSVSQELYFRGYEIYVLYEATDPMPERQKYKRELIEKSSLALYVKPLYFDQLESFLLGNDL